MEDSSNLLRGQEIPYNKKLLRNIDAIQELMPRVEKLNGGRPNQFGEMCYGGMC